MPESRLKIRFMCELAILTVSTILYFVLLPDRSTLVDVSAALCGLCMLALNAKFTHRVVWAQFPLAASRRKRWKQCLASVLPVTFSVGLFCFVTGMIIGYTDNGWPTAWQRVANWHILMAVGAYFPWALVQQTLCQFYLLSRLRTFFSPAVAITCTGLAFGLVHVPDVWIMTLTAGTGIFWTALYCRYRVLSPLALSHAVLGSTFFYWIEGKDLGMHWGQLVLSIL